MSHILKALRKSQLERELGQVPGLQAPYQDDLEPRPRRRWWPWVLGLVVVGNLGFVAVYAWQYVIPTRTAEEVIPPAQQTPGQAASEALPQNVATVNLDVPPEMTGAPAPTNVVMPEPATEGPLAQENQDKTLDLAAMTESLPLVPLETQNGEVANAGSLPVQQPPPDLSRPLSAEQLPNSAKSPGDGPERHSFPIINSNEAIPTADPTAPSMEQIAAATPVGQAATERVAVPEAWQDVPQQPRPRPADAIWAATVSAARAAAAADSAARDPAPLPAMTDAQDVARLSVVPPLTQGDVTAEAQAQAPAPTATAPPQQSAYVAPRLPETLGDVIPQEGVAAPGRDSNDTLPRYEQLTKEFRAKLPAVRLSAHVYDPSPQRRFARINKTKFREGDEIAPGLWLEAVTADGIVLRFDDTRFQMSSF